jgi:hypothetical protein
VEARSAEHHGRVERDERDGQDLAMGPAHGCSDVNSCVRGHAILARPSRTMTPAAGNSDIQSTTVAWSINRPISSASTIAPRFHRAEDSGRTDRLRDEQSGQ